MSENPGVLNSHKWHNAVAGAEAMANNAFFGALTAVVTVMTDGLASFFTDDIKNNLWPFLIVGGPLSIKASLFWLGVLLTGFLLGMGQWAQGRKSSRAVISLENMVARLQTLPADNYLPSYQDCCRIAAHSSFLVLLTEHSTKAQIEQAIRTVLGAVLETAKEFDKAWDDTEYSANIMIWRPAGGLGPSLEGSSSVHIVSFVMDDPKLAGVLELVPNLSTTTTKENYERDDSSIELVMPIPRDITPAYDAAMNQRHPILPGATWAFCYKVFALFTDVRRLASWLDTKTSIDTHSSNAMKDYFSTGKGKKIGSFGSVPILQPTAEARHSDTVPMGVLNLHSSRENLLHDNGQTLFVPLLEPFLMLLGSLLVAREAIGQSSPIQA